MNGRGEGDHPGGRPGHPAPPPDRHHAQVPGPDRGPAAPGLLGRPPGRRRGPPRPGSTTTRTPTRSGPTSRRSRPRGGSGWPSRTSRSCSARPGRSPPTPTWPTAPTRSSSSTPTTSATSTSGGCWPSTGRTATRSRCSCSAPRTRRPAGSPSWTTTGRVVSFVEKPKEPRSDLANGGVYVVDADAYREIAAMRAFDLGFEVLPRFVGRMRGWAWEGYHLDVGTLEALEKARRDAPGLLEGPAGRDRRPAGGVPRPRRDGDRAGPLPVRPGQGPAPARRRPGAPAAPGRRVRAGGGHQPVGDRPGDDHRRADTAWSTTRWTASSPPRG